ncbi:MAG TPA: chromate transporter [Candidatus Udaeobacter sp.]|jgi:chromate transporter|nr:chromate transporter [Candidatus Udaeobacter sp.]
MSLGQIWWQFVRIGFAAFGGLGVTLSLIERYLITNRRVLTAQDLTESLTYTKLLPGSTGVQVVGYLCYRLRGWSGAALGTTAFLLPAFLLMLLLSVLYEEITAGLGNAAIPALRGLTASVAGLLVATIYRLAKPTVTTVTAGVVAVAACTVGIAFSINPAWIVTGAGAVGILMPQWFTQEQKTRATKAKEETARP